VEYRDKYIEGKNVTPIVKALSNDFRIRILQILCEDDQTVQALMAKLELSKTAVITHLRILESSGFISSTIINGSIGNQRIYHKEYDRLIFNFTPMQENEQNEPYYEIQTDIGNYFDFQISPPCGLAKKDHIIQKWDDPSVFFQPERIQAHLLWGAFGFVEYRIPMNIPFEEGGFSRIEIMLEISAQGDLPTHHRLSLPDYIRKEQLANGVSDLTFFLNGVAIADYAVKEYSRIAKKGSLSGKKGKYTPGWWRGSNYGDLLKIVIDYAGVTINGEKESAVTLNDIFPDTLFDNPKEMNLDLLSDDSLKFRIAIRPEARRIGGFTIYGLGFGNYNQGIVTRFFSKNAPASSALD
jgi:predicted transcriptional regulator